MTASHDHDTEHDTEHASSQAEQVAEAVAGHPCVVRLDGGEWGVIATHLPGRKIEGVRTDSPSGVLEVGVVLRLRRPLPELVAEIRDLVRRVAGPVAVDVAVHDVEHPAPAPQDPVREAGGSGASG